VQGVPGVGDEPAHRDGRPDHVQQLHRRQPWAQLLAVSLAVVGHHVERVTNGRGYPGGPHVGDQIAEPGLTPAAGTPCPPVPRPRRSESVDHGDEVTGQRRRLLVLDRDPGPVRRRGRDDPAGLVEQNDRGTPASPDLFDAALRLPLMDTTRAHTELGWRPEHSATATVSELLTGLREGAGMATPPLTPDR